jgi:hypothetical protein
MVSFQSIVLLESMIKKRDYEDNFCVSEATSLKNETKVFEHGFLISSSLKNETTYEDSFFVSVATSLKNETEVTSIVLVSVSSSLKNEIVFPLSVLVKSFV